MKTRDTRSLTPVQMPGIEQLKQIALGNFHAVAPTDDGTVWVWGRNTHGQLGLPLLDESRTPVRVPGLTDVATDAGVQAMSAR